MKNSTKIITQGSAIDTMYGKEVTIQGYYRLMNVSKRPDQKVYSSRVYIELEDKRFVILETHEKGLRSKEEREKFMDKKVQVAGILVSPRVIWGDGKEASIVGVCLVDIKSIEEVK